MGVIFLASSQFRMSVGLLCKYLRYELDGHLFSAVYFFQSRDVTTAGNLLLMRGADGMSRDGCTKSFSGLVCLVRCAYAGISIYYFFAGQSSVPPKLPAVMELSWCQTDRRHAPTSSPSPASASSSRSVLTLMPYCRMQQEKALLRTCELAGSSPESLSPPAAAAAAAASSSEDCNDGMLPGSLVFFFFVLFASSWAASARFFSSRSPQRVKHAVA